MSTDTFTQTTRRSWFSRLAGSVGGIFFGILLVLVSLGVLFWNEGRAIKTERALSEGARIVLDVDASTPDVANDGRLVHVSGTLAPQGEPQDAAFGVAAPGAIRLERLVEMYQWREERRTETRTRIGGGQETTTIYEYRKEWSSRPISSSSFKIAAGHQNPELPVASQTFVVPRAMLGGFTLTGDQLGGLGAATDFLPDASVRRAIERYLSRPTKQAAGRFHTGAPDAPQIGDLRLSWSAAHVGEASVIAGQDGNGFGSYRTSNGRELFILRPAAVRPADMFQQEQDSNRVLTWILRFGGLVALFVGYALILRIFGVIGDLIPFVGRLVRAGTGLFALAMTALTGALAIAVGWIFFRPLIAAAVIAAGVLVALYVSSKRPASASATRQMSPADAI